MKKQLKQAFRLVTGHFSTIIRWPALATVLFATAFSPMRLSADDRAGVKIRMPKDTTIAATSGEEYAGTLEIIAPEDGDLGMIEVGGDGWVRTTVDLPPNPKMKRGEQINIPFHARCMDASKRIEIRVIFNGRVKTKRLDLSPERFARRGKARATVCIPPALLPNQSPAPIGGMDGGGPRGACDDYLLHFRGRFAYMRPGVDNNGDGDFDDPGADNNGDGDFDDPGVDNSVPPNGNATDPGDIAPDSPPDVAPALVGADRIEFSIMDDDLIDEEIFRGLTNEDGSFDVTVCWDDCDVSGCDDPDIYLYIECDTDIVNVQDGEDVLEEDYNWSTEASQYYPNFTGQEIDFGTVLPADPGEYPAIHIHNTLTRVHRFVEENDGAFIVHVDAQWPETDTEYIRFFEEIYIQHSEEWNEATQSHEWGHHLLYEWGAQGDGDYCNGYCDDDNANTCGGESCDNDGHCVWCQENAGDAWNEGFPDWLGSVMVRSWPARYSIEPWTQLIGMNGDGRYRLEFAQNCCDGNSHAMFAWITEGFVGMMLRDIEDPAPELPAGPPYVCPQDALDMSPRDIFLVVRESQPNIMMNFLQAFWSRFPQRAHDIKATATAVASVYGGLWATPPIEIYQTTSCDVAKAGQPIMLHVDTNGSPWSLQMRWMRNGVPLTDTATRTGCFTDTLTLSSASVGDSGVYTLKVALCDGTQEQTSNPMPVFVFGATGAGHGISGWGRNAFGSLGRGTLNPGTDANPANVININNAIDVSAGYWNSLALMADGTVRSFGAAYLGDGSANNSATPVQVSGLSNIVAISAGGYETCMALDADGHVWTWGSNYYGQIGDGSGQWQLTPIQVPGLSCVVAISMGAYSAAAVTADGHVWAWGSNTSGELGLGVTGGWYTTPQLVPGLNNIVEVECGWSHLIARRADGTVWCSGSNSAGQLGDGTTNNRNTFGQVPGLLNIISVKAGALHSLALQSDQTPWTWGYDGFGQLGRTTLPGNSSTPVNPANPQKARSLDGGFYNSLFVDTDGVIWTCGYWGYGALGRPSNDFAPAPVDNRVGGAAKASAGIDFMLAIAPGVRITKSPADQIVAGCGTAKLSVTAIGEPPLEYQWQRFNGSNWDVLYEGGRYNGTNGPVLTITSTTVNDAGSYRVVVTNPTSIVFSPTALLQTPPQTDTFDGGPTPRWTNERGGWGVAGGGYSAGSPSLSPATYSSFVTPMTDFSVEFDVVAATYSGFTANTGVWLRSGLTPSQPTGVLLSLGDAYPYNSGDVFWTRWNGSTWQSPEGIVQGVYGEGDTVHVRVDVRGDTYTAYINDAATPTTVLTTPDYPAGKIALFDNATTDTLIDNVLIQTLPNCEPGSGMTPPRVVQRPQSQTVAAGSPVLLQITVSGDGPLTFQWTRNGVCIPGADFTGYLFTASPATEGRYECAVTSPCGTVASFPAFITVTGALPPGDVDGDGDLDMDDVALFAQVLLGQDVLPEHVERADMNHDDVVDGRDEQPFVEAVVN